jgi:hypothetical protein
LLFRGITWSCLLPGGLNPEGATEQELKKDTLINLCTQRATQLVLVHRKSVPSAHCIGEATQSHFAIEVWKGVQ